ncbi:MAG: hypothetical protein H0X24_22700 [Ktedonobacterales bacterium]|nr:hypothetical protein [Ktedonobacterales bacterium]
MVIRPMTVSGDSKKWLARPRKKPHAAPPAPMYLLKRGKDAINERVASWLAQRYVIPHQIVRWTTADRFPEVAIRFETAAYRPDKIDAKTATALTHGSSSFILNPLDYYRHVALALFLDERDGEEFLITEWTLFRIDAAATCEGAHLRWIECLMGMPLRSNFVGTTLLFQDWVQELQAHHFSGYQAFLGTLQEMAQDTHLVEAVPQAFQASPFGAEHDLVACFQDYLQERQQMLLRSLAVYDEGQAHEAAEH